MAELRRSFHEQVLLRFRRSTEAPDTHSYEQLAAIGEGGFGQVSRVRHRGSNIERAMKSLPIPDEFAFFAESVHEEVDRQTHAARQEMRNLLKTRPHVNIVQWYDILMVDSDRLAIVMELCDLDLAAFLDRPKNRTMKVRFDVSEQVAAGMAFLHTHEPLIIHRDMKPQNVLIKVVNPRTNTLVAKIADFGISNVIDPAQTHCISDDDEALDLMMSQLGDADELGETGITTSLCRLMKTTVRGRGTLPFMAPEFFESMKGRFSGDSDVTFRVDASVDVFALGIVYAYIFCYDDSEYVIYMREGIPEQGLGEDMYDAYKNGDDVMPQVDQIYDADDPFVVRMKEFIFKMTSYNCSDRPSSTEVLQFVQALQNEYIDSECQSADKAVTSSQATGQVISQTQQKGTAATMTSSSPMRGAVRCQQLLQSLNDNNQAEMESCISTQDPLSVTDWINNKVGFNRIENPVMKFSDDFEQSTCLGFASFFSQASVVSRLVSAGADVTATDLYGETPLHNACWSRVDAEAKAKSLVESDAALVNVSDTFDNSALHAAAASGNSDVISFLVKQGVDVDHKEVRFGKTPLLVACEQGQPASVNALVQGGADCDVTDDEHDLVPLHLAVVCNQGACVEVLLGFSTAYINSPVISQITPLLWASHRGYAEVVRVLLSHKECDVNKSDDGFTALHYASRAAHVDIVGQLLTHGADAKAQQADNDVTALHLAVFTNDGGRRVRLLLQHGAPVNSRDKYGNTALHLAVSMRDAAYVDAIRILASSTECDVNATNMSGQTALHVACRLGHAYCVKVLVEHGAVVHAQAPEHKSQPIHLAAAADNYDCVMTLVNDCGASINATDSQGNTPLHVATINRSKLSMWRLAYHKECDVYARNDDNKTAHDIALENDYKDAYIDCLNQLYFASKRGDVKRLHELMKFASTDVNARVKAEPDKYHMEETTMHLAAKLNKADSLQALFQYKPTTINVTPLQRSVMGFVAYPAVVSTLAAHPQCDVNKADITGRTALHLAAINGHAQGAKILVENGADVEARTHRNRATALHLAVRYNHVDVVQALLSDCGAQINATDRAGFTALHRAALMGKVYALKTLLKHEDCDVNKRTNDGMTALDVALQRGHVTCVYQLIKHGGQADPSNHGVAMKPEALNRKEDEVKFDAWNKYFEVSEQFKRGWALYGRRYDNVSAEGSDDESGSRSEGQDKDRAAGDVKATGDVSESDGKAQAENAAKQGEDVTDDKEARIGRDAETKSGDVTRGDSSGVEKVLVKNDSAADDVESVTNESGAVDRDVIPSLKQCMNATDNYGSTALHLACRDGDVKALRQMMRYGADVNAQDRETGGTPLHLTAWFNHIDCAEALVHDYAAHVTARNTFGGTPLHIAALFGSHDVIKLLVQQRGVNVYSVDCRGRTALDCAVAEKHGACVKEMLKVVPRPPTFRLPYLW